MDRSLSAIRVCRWTDHCQQSAFAGGQIIVSSQNLPVDGSLSASEFSGGKVIVSSQCFLVDRSLSAVRICRWTDHCQHKSLPLDNSLSAVFAGGQIIVSSQSFLVDRSLSAVSSQCLQVDRSLSTSEFAGGQIIVSSQCFPVNRSLSASEFADGQIIVSSQSLQVDRSLSAVSVTSSPNNIMTMYLRQWHIKYVVNLIRNYYPFHNVEANEMRKGGHQVYFLQQTYHGRNNIL